MCKPYNVLKNVLQELCALEPQTNVLQSLEPLWVVKKLLNTSTIKTPGLKPAGLEKSQLEPLWDLQKIVLKNKGHWPLKNYSFGKIMSGALYSASLKNIL